MEFDSLLALSDIYASLDGVNWTNNYGWSENMYLYTPSEICKSYGITCNAHNHIVSIELPANGLQGELPDSFSGLPFLKKLNLKDNFIQGEIPESLAEIELEYLDLSLNLLTGRVPALDIALCDASFNDFDCTDSFNTCNMGGEELDKCPSYSWTDLEIIRTIQLIIENFFQWKSEEIEVDVYVATFDDEDEFMDVKTAENILEPQEKVTDECGDNCETEEISADFVVEKIEASEEEPLRTSEQTSSSVVSREDLWYCGTFVVLAVFVIVFPILRAIKTFNTRISNAVPRVHVLNSKGGAYQPVP